LIGHLGLGKKGHVLGQLILQELSKKKSIDQFRLS